MSFPIDIRFDETRQIPSKPSVAFEKLKQIEPLVRKNFPSLDRFEKNSDGNYIWHFREFGFGGKKIALELVTQFTVQPDGTLVAQSVPDSLHYIQAKWSLKEQEAGTSFSFHALLTFQVPLPGLMKGMVAPLAERELTKLFRQFTDNVAHYLA